MVEPWEHGADDESPFTSNDGSNHHAPDLGVASSLGGAFLTTTLERTYGKLDSNSGEGEDGDGGPKFVGSSVGSGHSWLFSNAAGAFLSPGRDDR